MLDSAFRERILHRNRTAYRTIQLVRGSLLAGADHCNPVCLLLQSLGSCGFGRAGRAALCVDRQSYGREWGLGYAAALRPTLVRKAATVLLGRRTQFRTLRSERGSGASAQRGRSSAGHASAGMAGLEDIRG